MINITASLIKISGLSKDAIDLVVRGIAGRWGKSEYKIYGDELVTYNITKSIVNVTWIPLVRGNVTIKLPEKAGNNGSILIISDNVCGGKTIFRGMDDTTLHLSGTDIVVIISYEV